MRKRTKSVIQQTDEQELNGWVLKYEYSHVEGAAPVDVRVVGSKDGGNVHINATKDGMSSNFVNGAKSDYELLAKIEKEIEAIRKG
jgi:hypothetical protein